MKGAFDLPEERGETEESWSVQRARAKDDRMTRGYWARFLQVLCFCSDQAMMTISRSSRLEALDLDMGA
jgi:hypothetical protein